MSRRHLVVLLSVIAMAHVAPAYATIRPGPSESAPVSPHAAWTAARHDLYADFDDDGYTDIAASVYDEDQGSLVDAGVVQIFYGGADGIGSGGNQIFSQNTPGIPDQSETGDEFGRNLGSGDYNCDGYTDLAAGVQGEDVVVEGNTIQGAGAVTVIYGGPNGLSATGGPGAQFWTESDLSSSDGPEEGDHMGWNSNIGTGNGDFNGDGCDDLATAINTEGIGAAEQAGAVVIVYGSPEGLSATAGPGNQFWSQDSPGILDHAEPFDIFGRGLASNDLDRNGYDDLVIGVEQEDLEGDPTIFDAGALQVIYGGPNGLQADAGPGNQLFTENDIPTADGAEDGDWLGRTGLMTGDMNGDGYPDVLAGILLEDVGDLLDAGAAVAIYSGPNGLDVDAGPGAQYWTQDSPGILDQSEATDLMGRYVEVADFNADGYEDAAIGIEWETLEDIPIQHTGAVNVIYGSVDGLQVNARIGNQFWLQDDLPCTDGSDVNDHSARMLAAGDYNADGYADLAIGVPGEAVGLVGAAGAFVIVLGSATGLTATGCQFWTQDTPGVRDQSEEKDYMARWLTSG